MESARSEIPTKPALLNSPLSSPQVLLALNHKLSMCSRPSSLVFPRSQVTHFSSDSSVGRKSFSVLEVSSYDLIHGLRYRSLAEQLRPLN